MRADSHPPAELGLLASFLDDVERSTTRTLDLLRAIDSTIDMLHYHHGLFAHFATFANGVAERLRTCERITPLDPEYKIDEQLQNGQRGTQRLYDALIEKRNIARQDPRITADDGLVDAYTSMIEATADVHNAINALQEALGEYEADLDSSVGPTYTDANALIADLRGGR